MSATNPTNQIHRQSVVGMEGMWVKMWDPPTESPPTPELMAPTNPVPEVMAAAGLQNAPSAPNTVQRDLLHGVNIPAYDGKGINFFLFRDADNPATGGGTFPGATIRLPRGSIFHGETSGHGPPPHTIHWHGIEPTPINDGVGHCSMEIGKYTYQWQPNFIGFYFCHCHRNTVQHFEYGLYQALLIEPPDAFFATKWDATIPIGNGRPSVGYPKGARRIAVNLDRVYGPGGGTPMDACSGLGFEGEHILYGDPRNSFPGYVAGHITDADPEAGNLSLPSYLKFAVNPHAMTVPYDVEALWVVDDRDSVWSDLAPDARDTYPKHGSIPGVNDNFHSNAGGGISPTSFFAFNDFHPDYWYVTGINFPGTRIGKTDALGHAGTGTGTIPEGIVIPAQLMSGVSGVQVSIEAKVGQTILIRALGGAYNNYTMTFPMDVTIIAWDGRSLGVAPFNECNHPYLVPAGTPINSSVARRTDMLVRVSQPVNDFAIIEFEDTRCGTNNSFVRPVLFTGRIPINIGYGISGNIQNTTDELHPVALDGVNVTLTLAGSPGFSKTVVTDSAGNYSFAGLANGSYTVTPGLTGFLFSPASSAVNVSGLDVTGKDFSAVQAAGTFVISGAVVGSRGDAAGIPRVIVSLTGAATRTVLTDDMGHFRVAGLAAGNYAVTPGDIATANAGTGGPTTTAFAYSPTSAAVTLSNANLNIGFFRARHVLMPGQAM